MTLARTRMRAVYLTDIERDLVVQALDLLADRLSPPAEQHQTLTRVTLWARSYSRQRILTVMALFRDKLAEEKT